MKELSVCIGSSCHVRGSYNVIQTFTQCIERYALHDKVEFKSSFCMKQCDSGAVGVKFDGRRYSIPSDKAEEFFIEEILPELK